MFTKSKTRLTKYIFCMQAFNKIYALMRNYVQVSAYYAPQPCVCVELHMGCHVYLKLEVPMGFFTTNHLFEN